MDKAPDISIDTWDFFFDEMKVTYKKSYDLAANLKWEEESGQIFFMYKDGIWRPFFNEPTFSAKLSRAYSDYIFERECFENEREKET